MKQVIGYIRISGRDQSNFSLPGQEDAVQKFCRVNDYELLSIYKDNGASARSFDRPDWANLHDFVKKHFNKIDFLVLSKYDRFSRNLNEALSQIELFENTYKILIVSATEPITLHRDSPYYFKFRTDYLTGAHLERLVISERTKRGVRDANLKGRWVNNAPFGYINSRDDKGIPGILLIDEQKAAVIKNMFTMIYNGKSIPEVRKWALENGYKNQSKFSINRTLTNIVYTGKMKVNKFYDEPETIVNGLHSPIISEDLFFAVGRILSPAKQHRSSKLSSYFFLRGIVACVDCDKNFTAAFSKGKTIKVGYYFCIRDRRNNYNSSKMHQNFYKILDNLSFPDEVLSSLKKAVILKYDEYNNDRIKSIFSNERQLSELLNKSHSLEEKYLSDQVDKELYQKWKGIYVTDIAAIKAILLDLKKPMSDLRKSIENNLHLLNNLSWLFDAATIEQKHTFLKLVFERGLRFDGVSFRTHYILPLFASKLNTLADLGLLQYEGDREELIKIAGCSPYEIRTRIPTVKGWCPNP
jgi:site-specific DNA recombinase